MPFGPLYVIKGRDNKSFVKKWTRNSPRFPEAVMTTLPHVKRNETLILLSGFLLQPPTGYPKVQWEKTGVRTRAGYWAMILKVFLGPMLENSMIVL